MTGYPLTNYNHIDDFVNDAETGDLKNNLNNGVLTGGPVVLHGTFNISASAVLLDTYFDSTGWGKVNN